MRSVLSEACFFSNQVNINLLNVTVDSRFKEKREKNLYDFNLFVSANCLIKLRDFFLILNFRCRT